MAARQRINQLRKQKEKYLKKITKLELDDNDRLWCAVTSIMVYLEEVENERRKSA